MPGHYQYSSPHLRIRLFSVLFPEEMIEPPAYRIINVHLSLIHDVSNLWSMLLPEVMLNLLPTGLLLCAYTVIQDYLKFGLSVVS